LEFSIWLTGVLALSVTAGGFAIKDDRLLQKANLAGCGLWMTHFALLGAPVASGMMLLAIVMIGASVMKLEKVSLWAWRGNLALLPVVALSALLGFLSWSAFPPVLAGFLINTGVSRCRGWKMTAMIALGAAMWATTGLIEGSWPALLANILNLGALSFRAMPRRKSETVEPEAAPASL
jgi:hypothetical protein